MEDSPDERVKIKYPHSGFFMSTAMKLLEYLKVSGLGVCFPLGPTCYQWRVGTNSLKYEKKN